MKTIHCIGIGGIGVSALARFFLSRGAKVSGSDGKDGAWRNVLENEGVRVFIGHDAKNIPADCDLVIYSSAVPENNTERQEALRRGIAQKTYAEGLGEAMKEYPVRIAVSGTHGKTTMTALIGLMFEEAKKDPMVIVGGKVSSWEGNFRNGHGKIAIAELKKGMNGSSIHRLETAVNHAFGRHAPKAIRTIVKLAIENDLLDLKVRKIKQWIRALQKYRHYLEAAEIAVALRSKKKRSIEDTRIKELFDQSLKKGPHFYKDSGQILKLMMENDVHGINANDVNNFILSSFLAREYFIAAEVAISAMQHGFAEKFSVDVIKDSVQRLQAEGGKIYAREIVLKAIEAGIEETGFSLRSLKGSIDDDLDYGRDIDNAWQRVVDLLRMKRKLEGVDINDAHRWFDGFLDETSVYSESIALGAIENNIEGLKPNDIKIWIAKLIARGRLSEAARIAAVAYPLIFSSQNNNQLIPTIQNSFRLLSRYHLLPISQFPEIIKMIIASGPEEFNKKIQELENLKSAFKEANKKLPRTRRHNQKKFEEEYSASLYALEILLPGSLRHLKGLLHQSSNPQGSIRFLESKKEALLNEPVFQSLKKLIDELNSQKEGSRKKISIDQSAIFKIIDIANSYVNTGKKNEFINQMNGYSKDTPISDLIKELSKGLLTPLAESFGIDKVTISPEAYKKIYFPFLSRLNQAKNNIEHSSPHRFPAFKGLIKAILEDRFWGYIEDENQNDATGRKIANHNKNVRGLLEKTGINVSRWLGKTPQERQESGEIFYVPSGITKHDPVSEIESVIDYLQRTLKLGLQIEHRQGMEAFLQESGLSVENKKELVLQLSKPTTLTKLLQLTHRILSFEEVQGNILYYETVNHFKERVDVLKARLSATEYRQALSQGKHFTVRPIFRNPGNDLFMGDFTSCCLAMNSSLYPHAMVERLIDEGMNVIEVVDDLTGKPIANLWLYIAEDGSLVIQNMEINSEYEKQSQHLTFAIGQGMINYAAEFAKQFRAKRLLIGQVEHGKYFTNGFVRKRYGERVVPFELGKIGGSYDGKKYYLDSEQKESAYLQQC